jgi:hypothetical protein
LHQNTATNAEKGSSSKTKLATVCGCFFGQNHDLLGGRGVVIFIVNRVFQTYYVFHNLSLLYNSVDAKKVLYD